jgi:signal transduction histidine kinase
MLAADVEDRPQALEMVSRIQRAQKDLQTLHEEVRQYAAPIKLVREPTDLGQLWREVWSQLAHARRGKEIVLRADSHGVDLCCQVDRFTIGQVWRNILENAIEVSPERAEIVIQCAERCIDGQKMIQISFRDAGPGMSADQRARIFEPFFTTKAKGTGLGMAIAQRIVSSHDGSISVAETDGPGAEIVVVLPRKQP